MARLIIGGMLGAVLAFNGLTVLTWGFWAVIALVTLMVIVHSID